MIKWNNNGVIRQLLRYITDLNAAFPNIRIGLYQNNYDPQGNDLLAAYTPASFPGYADKPLSAISNPFLSGDQAVSNGPITSWNWSGGPGTQTLYGWYVWDATSGYVQWAEKFATPFVISAGTPTIQVGFTLTDQSQF